MRIVLFWDEPLLAAALKGLFDKSPIDAVAVSDDLTECLAMLRSKQADALLVKSAAVADWSLIKGAILVSGIAVIAIGEPCPGDGVTCLSANTSPEELFRLLGQFATQVKRPKRARTRRSSALGLSAREEEVARLVSRGMNNRRIAEITGLQEQSVKNTVSVVMRRLGCANRTQLALRLTEPAKPEHPAPTE